MVSLDHKAAIAAAMDVLSGQRGGPDGALVASDFSNAFAALERAQSVPFAKAKLAVLTAMGCGTERNIDVAIDLYHAAVLTGFPPLLRDMAVIIDSVGGDKGMVRNLLMRAAGAGDPVAAEFVQMWEHREPPVTSSALDIAALKTALQQSLSPSLVAQPQSLSEQLPIFPHKSALTPMQCDYLMLRAQGLLQPSKVVDGASSKQAGFRTSDGATFLPSHMDWPILSIATRLASLAHAAPEQGEFLALLRYRPGQEYRPHHDYLQHDEADYAKIGTCGQRKATVLTYLNIGYQGGETIFPKLDVSFKGSTGDSLVFHNVGNESQPLPQSLHAGTPVTDGEKWLVTLWVREKRFWPW